MDLIDHAIKQELYKTENVHTWTNTKLSSELEQLNTWIIFIIDNTLTQIDKLDKLGLVMPAFHPPPSPTFGYKIDTASAGMNIPKTSS